MKKITLFPGLLLWLALSCNTKKQGELSATAQKNMDAMHGITKCFETKDFSKLGDFIAADGVDHAGEQGDIKGVENMKAEFARTSAGFSSMKSEVIRELADDEYVMSWMKFTGVFGSDMYGKKAGDTMVSASLEVSRFKDGKAVEHWTFMEPAEMMKMMGGAMPPGPASDSTGTSGAKKP